MKFRNQKLNVLLVAVFAAALALPTMYGPRTKTVEAGVQEPSRNDVKTPTKNRLGIPNIPSGAAPANDNCADGISINSCPFTDTKDTSGATDEAGEPQSTCTIGSS